uniref:Uncharacterized protein n=1 Tax=mine drainage metagenome TaxID=410659 RepID=E6PTM3_9ZZZZ
MLTTAQFQTLIGKLPEVKAQREEMGRLFTEMSKDRLDSLLVRGFNWGEIYECSFVEHIAIAFVAFGRVDWLNEAAQALDPQQHVLDAMELEDDDAPDGPAPGFEKQDLIGLTYSLQRTVLSILLYQRSLSALVQDVRENDNMDALFDAVRVDRAAMNCTTIADKIARAQLRGDKRFFLRLRNALKGPTQKHWQAYCDLRYSLVALRDLGFDKLTDTQLEQLLVHDLKVYPNTPSARKNLRAQYQRSRKIKTI